MEVEEYGISLRDQMSGPAHDAAKSVHELSEELTKTKKDLAGFQGQLSLAKNLGDIAGYKKYTDLVGTHRQKVFELAGALEGMAKPAHESHSLLEKLKEGFIRTVEPAEVLKGAFEGVGAGLSSFVNGLKSGEAKEMVNGLAESLAGLAQLLDLVVPGLGQAAAAAIKFGGAIAAASVGFIQKGMELAIEANHARDSMIDMFSALGGGREAGLATEEMLDVLSDKIGITKKELAPFTASFQAMGIHGTEALEKITTAAISARAITKGMGKDGASAFESLTKKIQVAAQTNQGFGLKGKAGLKPLADMGIEVAEVASKMGVSTGVLAAQLKAGTVNASKFGDALQTALIDKGAGPLRRMASSFENLKAMFSQNIDKMFEGVDIEPFMSAVKDLFSIFGQSHSTGKILKAGLGGAFTYIFQVATKAILPIKHFLLDVIYWSLKAYIQIKKHWSTVKTILEGVGVVFGVIGVAVAAMFAPFVIAAIGVGLLVTAVGAAIGAIIEWDAHAIDAAKSFVTGLATGISNGVGVVAEAAKKLATSAWEATKSALHINSPSKLMMNVGRAGIAGGVALGIHTGTPQVRQAASKMSAAAVGGTVSGVRASDYTPPAKDDAKSARAGASAGPVTINIMAPNGVTHALELTETAVSMLFERYAMSQGVGGAT